MISIKRLLYSLKNRYGQLIDFYQETDSTPVILTGKIIKSRVKYTIKKGIILKEKTDLSSTFLKQANATESISGLIEINLTEILIDGNDFPKDFIPKLGDYVVSNKEIYSIDVMKNIDKGQAYYFGLKEFKGSQVPQIYNVNLHQKLTLIHLLKQHV